MGNAGEQQAKQKNETIKRREKTSWGGGETGLKPDQALKRVEGKEQSVGGACTMVLCMAKMECGMAWPEGGVQLTGPGDFSGAWSPIQAP